MIQLIISLVSGALGGNVAGSLLKKFSLGTVGNSIVGILGGGIGGKVLSMLGLGAVAAAGGDGGMDISSILGSLASGGVGGGVLMAVIGFVKNAMNK